MIRRLLANITLAGQVNGDLTAKADVALPAESRLDGNIRANKVEVGGTVKGNIAAKGKVRLGSHACVEGDIDSTALAVAEGAAPSERPLWAGDGVE